MVQAPLDRIIAQLKEVYDPEMPIVDIYTLGLIYDVQIDEEEKKAHIIMTFTTPACPMADLLEEMVKNAMIEAAPEYSPSIEITFDPLWNLDMVKDSDVKRMFE